MSYEDSWMITFEKSGADIEPVVVFDNPQGGSKQLFIQMEYCGGDNLRTILDNDFPSIDEK